MLTPRASRLVLIVLVLSSTIVLAGCRAKRPSTPSRNEPSGIRGTLLVTGGPMVSPGKAPQSRPLAGAVVIVHAAGPDGDELARQTTGADGTFEFTLPPGTYTLTARQWQAMPQTVTVKPGEYVTVTFEIAAG